MTNMTDGNMDMNGMGESDDVTSEIVDGGRSRSCPWKTLGDRDGLMPAIASAALMAGVIAVSCYGQYLLTKWACKAAIRQTRR